MMSEQRGIDRATPEERMQREPSRLDDCLQYEQDKLIAKLNYMPKEIIERAVKDYQK